MIRPFTRFGAVVVASIALFAVSCGPAVEGIDKGFDVVEIRTLAGPVLIQDQAKGTAIAKALLQAVEGVSEAAEVGDQEVRSGDRPYVRLSLLDDEQAGKWKVVYSLLLFGPSQDGSPGALCFRSRDDAGWRRAALPPAAINEALRKIGAAASIDLAAVAALTAPQLDAVRRSIVKVSGERGLFGEDLALVSCEDVTWPNTALGFPKPDLGYAMMLVEGHRVILRLPDGSTVECHTSADRVELGP